MPSDQPPPTTVVAFYLPQFHPTPENDEWWGPGFTEWTNVAQARPLFRGHRQPDLPADLGFYDLRVSESREQQATLARTHGVGAFCYWHYWFAGRQLLELPFNEVLKSGTPDFPFCLAWANQTWSGVWHGAPDRVLMEQTYPGPDDDEAHFEHLLPAFLDPRYLRVDGRPLFYLFRPEQHPDLRSFVTRWQHMARAAGLPGLYLVTEISDLHGDGPTIGTPEEVGFDVGVYVRIPFETTPWTTLRMRARRKLRGWPEVYNYSRYPLDVPDGLDKDNVFPCVYPNWDNTPRSGTRGLVLRDSTPELFKRHVEHAVARLRSRPESPQLLFVKSWNEWAEGNHVEPDLVHGHGWLEAIRSSVMPSL